MIRAWFWRGREVTNGWLLCDRLEHVAFGVLLFGLLTARCGL